MEQNTRLTRNTGLWITGISAVLCGLPGLIFICFGLLAAIGALSPGGVEDMTVTLDDVLATAVASACIGGLLFAIPVIAAVFTFNLARNDEPAVNEQGPTIEGM